MSRELKGLLLAVLSAVAAAAFIVPYKVAVDTGNGAGLVFVLLGGAAGFNTLASVGFLRSRLRFSRFGFWVAVIMTVFTILGNLASMQAIAVMHPAVASALLQSQVLYVALVGYFVLHERVSLGYWFGAACALCGVYILRVPADASTAISVEGLIYANVGAFCFGMLLVITRKVISRIEPVSVNAVRLWLSVIALAAIPSVRHSVTQLTVEQIWLTLIAAFFGPFLARVSLMYSARYIPAARAVLFSLTTPVFALAFTWILLGTLPNLTEVLGSGLVLVGVLVPLVAPRERPSNAAE